MCVGVWVFASIQMISHQSPAINDVPWTIYTSDVARYDYSHYNLKQSPKGDEVRTLIHLQDRPLLYQQLYCERQESYKTLVKNSDALPGNKTPMILTSKALTSSPPEVEHHPW